MAYGPYNYGPEVVDNAKQKATELGSAAVAPLKSAANNFQKNAGANNPNYSLIAPSQGGPSKTRTAIDQGAKSFIGNVRENFAPAVKQGYDAAVDFTSRNVRENFAPAVKKGYDAAVDFTSRNVIEPVASADYSNARSVINAGASPRAGLGVTNRNAPPKQTSIADGYTVVPDKQVAVQRGPGLDPIFRGSVGQPGDAANALDQGRQVNAIRQETINMNRQYDQRSRARAAEMAANAQAGQPSQYDRVIQQQLKNIDDLQNGRFSGDKEGQRLYRATQALSGVSGDLTSRENNLTAAGSSRYSADATAIDNANDNALLAERNRIADMQAQNEAMYKQQAQEARVRGDTNSLFNSISSDIAGFMESGDDDGLRQYLKVRGGTLQGTPYEDQFLNMVEGLYFDGGLVETFSDGGMVERFAAGGPVLPQAVPGQPAGPDPALMNKYQEYASSAMEMGLTAVPFDQFAGLQKATGQTIETFAGGGQVPGRMAIDQDPNAPTDSIPAEIDGERPAAINSGEFIFPTDVVLYYGTDKLTKMIEKARDTGEESDGPEQSTAFQLGAQ